MDHLGKQEVHGQNPVVSPFNKQSLNQFELQSRGQSSQNSGDSKGGPPGGSARPSSFGGGGGGSRGRGRFPVPGIRPGGGGGNDRFPLPPGSSLPPGFQVQLPPRGIPPNHHPSLPMGRPNIMGPPPPPMQGPPPMAIVGPPHRGGDRLPPPVVIPGQPFHHGFPGEPLRGPPPPMPPVGHSSGFGPFLPLSLPHHRGPAQGPLPPPPPPPPPPGAFPLRPGPPGVHSAHLPPPMPPASSSGPPLHMGLPHPPPPPGMPLPAPHVNPAFFPPGGAPHPPSDGRGPPPLEPFGRPPPFDRGEFRRSEVHGRGRDMEPPGGGLSEAEFEEIMNRNRAISSSAISRAVSDASAGEYGSAIETLVTAISLIKQSKVSADERCKVLISSLQDCLHGIESKSYGSGGRKRERSRERDHSRSREKSRRHKERSRSRERHDDYYRDRERHRDRDRERDREREREYRHR
uniref:Cleavage and polyadenylation specific factor 6 n=1 Tax=Eptatretus burgeri TaxID=7764 RepID=A0A8C4NDK8_EPTBU